MASHKIIAAICDNKVKQQLEKLFLDIEQVDFFKEPAEILDKYQSNPPQILIIERELPQRDGISIFKQIKKAFPDISGIILSGNESTDLAVEAARAGADEYLHKILHLGQLKDIVMHILSLKSKKPLRKFFEIEGSEWLYGESLEIKKMFISTEEALNKDLEILLIGENGINFESLAKLIHLNRGGSLDEFIKIDMLSFSKENNESFFWNMLQEIIQEHDTSVPYVKKRTLYLEGFENLPPHFEQSIFDFLKKKQNIKSESKIPRQVKIIIRITPNKYQELKLRQADILAGFVNIFLPPLSSRKEDLISMINAYLNKFSTRYNKNINAISTEVLEFFSNYSWPGNYLELERFIENAVLRTAGENSTLQIKDVPLDLRMVMVSATRSILRKEKFDLGSAHEIFESLLLKILTNKFHKDKERMATFLDLPQAELEVKLGKYNL